MNSTKKDQQEDFIKISDYVNVKFGPMKSIDAPSGEPMTKLKKSEKGKVREDILVGCYGIQLVKLMETEEGGEYVLVHMNNIVVIVYDDLSIEVPFVPDYINTEDQNRAARFWSLQHKVDCLIPQIIEQVKTFEAWRRMAAEYIRHEHMLECIIREEKYQSWSAKTDEVLIEAMHKAQQQAGADIEESDLLTLGDDGKLYPIRVTKKIKKTNTMGKEQR